MSTIRRLNNFTNEDIASTCSLRTRVLELNSALYAQNTHVLSTVARNPDLDGLAELIGEHVAGWVLFTSAPLAPRSFEIIALGIMPDFKYGQIGVHLLRKLQGRADIIELTLIYDPLNVRELAVWTTLCSHVGFSQTKGAMTNDECLVTLCAFFLGGL